MKEPLYHEVLRRARADLGDALGWRNQLRALLENTEKEIAQLKRLIGGVYAYIDESEKQDDLLETGEGLKGAISTALRAANQDVTVSEILSILRELQFPIDSHQNPLGSIYTTVTRLVADGDVVPGEPRDDKKTYRWKHTLAPLTLDSRRVLSAAMVLTTKTVKKR